MAEPGFRGWPGPEYRMEIEFRAPLKFVYRWCTDFSEKDAGLEREKYRRKVLSRTSRQVVFEDLEEDDSGFFWARDVVELRPPDRWQMESVGSHRALRAVYRLTETGPGRTRLSLRFRRRPTALERVHRTKAARERSVLQAWKYFRSELESDYRRSARRKG